MRNLRIAGVGRQDATDGSKLHLHVAEAMRLRSPPAMPADHQNRQLTTISNTTYRNNHSDAM